MPAPQHHRILRVGIVQGGRILEERLVPAGETVTVGESGRSTFVLPPTGLKEKRYPLFLARGEEYYLRFNEEMRGKIATENGVQPLPALRQQANRKGSSYHLAMKQLSRGAVQIGDVTVLFQWVAAPPRPRRVDTSGFHSWTSDFDSVYAALVLVSALLHGVTVGVFWQIEPPEVTAEVIVGNYFNPDVVLAPEPEPIIELEPDPEPSENGPIIEVARNDTPEPVAEPEPAAEPDPQEADGSAENEPAEASEPAEANAGGDPEETEPAGQGDPDAGAAVGDEPTSDQIASAVEQLGLVGVIGTAGQSDSGLDAVADLLSNGGELNGDVAAALRAGSDPIARRQERTDEIRSGREGVAGRQGIADGVPGGSPRGPAIESERFEERAPEPTMEQGPVDVTGTGNGIEGTVRRNRRRFKACYDQFVSEDSSLEGRVELAWTIETDGSVADIDVLSNSTGNEDFASCLVRSLRRWDFPEQADFVDVAMPFNFFLN